jgi:hypothetical protein
MINRRKAYLPMRTRRSLSVNAAENVVLTDGFPCVVASTLTIASYQSLRSIGAARRSRSKIAGSSPAFRRPGRTIARGSYIEKAGFARARCPQRLVPKAFMPNVEAGRLARR